MSNINADELQTLEGSTIFSLSGNTVNFPQGFNPPGLVFETWTTATRPSSPTVGEIGYNSETVSLEVYYGIDPFDGAPLWGTYAGNLTGGAGLKSDLETLNSSLTSYTYNQVAQIKAEFEAQGFTLIATPAYNGMAENQGGTSNISSLGQFNSSEFDSGTEIELTAGLDNGTLNGYPYMIFAGFGPNGYEGVALQIYRDYSNGTALKNFFSPNQNRNIYGYVLNKDGSEVVDDSGNTSTIYSDGQSPNSNGYNSTSRFASDDGCWGFRIGANRLDGNGGPYLQDNSSDAYGCENRNGGDAVDDFFWGSASNTSTTNYGFYFAVRYV
jgi:hypothetical protein